MTVKDVGQIGNLGLIEGSKKTTRSEPETEREEKVTVSQSADLSGTISAAQVSSSASRASVVQAITNAVRQGSYKPDAQRIAQQILEDAEVIARLTAMLKKR